MIFEKLKSGVEIEDETFDVIYPLRYRKISKIHFTPIKVAQVAARYLVEKPGTRVLDVGSGAGKFCMVGAACTEGYFVGVEQRKHLHSLANKLSKRYNLEHIDFIASNVVEIDFEDYDAIYYFNAFYENIFHNGAIDSSVTLDKTLYSIYTQYMREQLNKMPLGTRLATYFSFMDEVPNSYKIKSADFDLKLKLWEKVSLLECV
ncbi:MAG: methyltransferase domain-containing protein [Saprospiraceae bacterium]|nr:methyltransferase domain-containing protein [Saprospiraceae bacterium]